jgi:V8-like Glu-specific endopeptidase
VRTRRSFQWLSSGRMATLAIASVLVVTACTVSTAGHPVRAGVGDAAGPGGSVSAATSSSAPATVTRTAVRTVQAAPKVTYRVAAPLGKRPDHALVGLPWWSAAVDTNFTSSLTTDGSHDDSASIYIAPTSAVRPKNAAQPKNSATGNVWSGVGLTGRTNGQLIGLTGNQAYTCSGTVVHSAAKNLVLTAGHCVWNIPVGKPANKGGPPMVLLEAIWFIPGASNLSKPLTLDTDGRPEVQAPYGIWKVNGARTNDRWMQNTWITQSGRGLAQTELMHGVGSYDDIAFVTVDSLDGQEIETVTGAQGLLFTNTANTAPEISYPTVVLGYPSAEPFDGSDQRYCTQREPDTYEGDARVQTAQVSCALTPGASGGAWFTGFDNVAGAGYIYGVTSRGGDSRLAVGMLSLADDYPLYRKVAG